MAQRVVLNTTQRPVLIATTICDEQACPLEMVLSLGWGEITWSQRLLKLKIRTKTARRDVCSDQNWGTTRLEFSKYPVTFTPIYNSSVTFCISSPCTYCSLSPWIARAGHPSVRRYFVRSSAIRLVPTKMRTLAFSELI